MYEKSSPLDSGAAETPESGQPAKTTMESSPTSDLMRKDGKSDMRRVKAAANRLFGRGY